MKIEQMVKVRQLLAHVAEQAEKQQFLNAADASAELTRVLLACLGKEMKGWTWAP
jgi:hypothetical protein